jgi:hypothetical protein
MKTKILYLLFLVFLFVGQLFAQPAPYYGTFLFNLTEQQYPSKLMTVDDLNKKDIRFLSFDKESIFKYDTINKAFSFTTNGIETKQFAIIHKNDTLFIDYPSILAVSIFVKVPIPLDSIKSYSFSNEYIYDAIHSNKNKYLNSIFYLCQSCFLSRYKMNKETKKRLKKSIHWKSVELKEE